MSGINLIKLLVLAIKKLKSPKRVKSYAESQIITKTNQWERFAAAVKH